MVVPVLGIKPLDGAHASAFNRAYQMNGVLSATTQCGAACNMWLFARVLDRPHRNSVEWPPGSGVHLRGMTDAELGTMGQDMFRKLVADDAIRQVGLHRRLFAPLFTPGDESVPTTSATPDILRVLGRWL